MNRAQRRMKARHGDRQRAQRRVSPASAWMAQRIAMVKSDMSELDAESKRDVLTAVYAQLEQLRTGALDYEGFMQLIEMNAVAGEIAYQLQRGDESGQITAAGFACVAAAEALQGIGERRGTSGRFVATGAELTAIREAAQYASDLLDLSPRGTTLAAMDKIRRHVDRVSGRRSAF